MEKDKKYNVVLGLMIFFFILVVGISLAWGLSSIGKKTNNNEIEKQNSNIANKNEISDVEKVEDDVTSENKKQENTSNSNSNKNESQNKVEKITNIERVSIEEYIEKIYLYGTGGVIPNFTDINEADEEWLWRVAFMQCQNLEMVYKWEIISNAKDLFGTNLKKEPGTNILGAYWDEEGQYYTVKHHGLMVEDEPHYIIYDIVKNDNKYSVEVIDYVLDISETLKDIENAALAIKSNDKVIKKVSEVTEYSEIQKYVKENASKFSSRMLEIEENEGKLHIVACKNK